MNKIHNLGWPLFPAATPGEACSGLLSASRCIKSPAMLTGSLVLVVQRLNGDRGDTFKLANPNVLNFFFAPALDDLSAEYCMWT